MSQALAILVLVVAILVLVGVMSATADLVAGGFVVLALALLLGGVAAPPWGKR